MTSYQATIVVDHGVSLGMGSNYPERSEMVSTFEISGAERLEHGIGTERFTATKGIYGALREQVKDIVGKGYLSNPQTGLVRIALKELREEGQVLVPSRDDVLESRVMLGYSPLVQFFSRASRE